MRVVILTVVLATVLGIDAKQSLRTKRNACTGVPDGTFVANDESCSNFFVCYNGEAVVQSCNRGSYFDRTETSCLPDIQNICPQAQPKCAVDGEFSPHPNGCSLFYVCSDGELIEQSCLPGSYFDSTNLYCIPDTNNVCQQSECSENGAYSPHPTNCLMFYICYDGKLVEQSCKPGSYFDKTNLNCVPDTNNVCMVAQCTEEGEFVPHPTQCDLFYVCYNGSLVEQTCGSGSYFDKTNLYCTPDSENICWPLTPSTEAPCTCVGGYTNGEFIANPDSCYSYYVCSGGELVQQNCGYGNYFNNDSKVCEEDKNGSCWTGPVTESTTTTAATSSCSCPGGYEEGDLVGDSNSCHSYFVCTQGELIAQSCGTGNYFDVSMKACARDDNGSCWPTTTAPAPCQCSGGYEEGNLVENSESCHSYFVCTQGELIAQSCGTGNYFDVSTKTCARDENGRCWPTTTAPVPCQCAGGYEEGNLVENSDSCHSYFVCTQGELIAQSCGTGNYFDVSTKTCARDENGSCWPTTTSTTTTAPVPCQCAGGYEEGNLVENSDSCHSYFVCTQGELIAQSCGTGNYFDVSTKTCARDENGSCWPTTTSTTTTAPVPCQCAGGYEEGDLVANSDNCSSYFICIQGNLVEQDCGSGNYFDATSKNCVHDVNGICRTKCPGGYEGGDLVANSDNCSSYFICIQGNLVEQDCGSGNYFDATSKNCVHDVNGICRTKCPGGYEGGDLVANSDNCSSYFICIQGNLVEQDCGSGNYFDATSKNCVHDVNGICRTKCPGGYEGGDLVANSDNCSSYFICIQGNLVEQDCGSGNYFDATSKNCVHDVNGICRTKCPGGYEGGDLVANSDNCSSYFICIQGNLVEQDCGSGNYFDATSKNCVHDVNGICRTKCPGGYEGGDLVANSDNCSSYFICIQGNLVEQDCGSGNYFDATSKNCVHDVNGICRTKCPGGYEGGDLVANSDNCSSYFLCIQGNLVAQDCGSGYYFDATSKNCVLDVNGICRPSTCPGGYANNELISYPGSCYKFYICFNGELLEKSCQQGNYFDSISKSCVVDETGMCWPTSSTPSTTTASTITAKTSTISTSSTTTSKTTPSTITPSSTAFTNTPSSETPSTMTPSTTTETPCTCPGDYEDTELVPYPGSCYKFCICFNGEVLEESCHQGNYFDPVSKSCVVDETGLCWPTSSTPSTTSASSTPTPSTLSTSSTITSSGMPSPSTPSSTSLSTPKSTTTPPSTTLSSIKPSTGTPSTTCPGGYEDGEFIPYPDNCYKFYMCYNGELLEESCGQGNYFNSTSKSCVQDKTGVCWPMNSTPSTTTVSTTTGSTTTPTTTSSTSLPTTPTSTTPSSTTPSTTTLSTTASSTTPSSEITSTATPSTLSTSSTITTSGMPSPSTPSSTTLSTPKSTTTPSSTTPSSITPSTGSPSTTTSTTTPSSEISSTTTEATCTCPGGYEDGEFIPYPDNCYKFYMCYNGELLEESCGQGNYFDSTSKSCVQDKTGVCWPMNSTPSTTTVSTTTASTTTPTTTSSTSLPTTPTSTTPSSTTPSPTTLSTTASSTTPSSEPTSTATPSTTTEVPCTCPGGYDQGEFIPYPDSCYEFYICFDGELLVESCGQGNYFDHISKSCVRDKTGVCWPINSTTTVSTTTASTTMPTTKSSTPLQTTPPSTTLSSTEPSSTMSSSTSLSPTIPSPTTPSPTTPSSTTPSSETPSTMTPSTTTQTPRTCPGGYENSELISYPGSCYKFYICFDGELLEESCHQGNYFDPISKTCVLDETGLCWPMSSTPSTTTASKTTASTTVSTTTLSSSTSSTSLSTTSSSTTLSSTTPTSTIPSSTSSLSTITSSTTVASTTPSTAIPTTKTSSTTTPSTTPSSATPSTTTVFTTTETPCSCPGGYMDGEFIPHPDSCYLFYVCYQSELVEVSCGFGNYFDEVTKSCVLDTTGICWSRITSTSTTTSTASAPCTCSGGYEEGDFIASPESCYRFYICYQGELNEMSCGVGNYFDNSTKSCALDTAGICWPKITPSPTTTAPRVCPNGYQNGQIVSNPMACYMYYICIGGDLIAGDCGTGNYFNNASNVCEPDTGGCCWPLNTPSQPQPPSYECSNGLQEGQFSSSPSACYLYNICHNGQLLQGNCGAGNYFNSATNTCEADTSGSCRPSNPNSPPQPPSYGCPNGVKEGQLIANPSSCYLYSICYNGQLLQGNCGTGNYFNNATNACEADTGGCCWPQSYGCSNGLQEGQFSSSPSACYLYNICHNGQLLQGNCGDGNYFNSATNTCEADTSGSCRQLNPNSPPQPPSYGCPNGVKEGQLIANPTSCYLYSICYNGQILQGNCGTGNYFNNATNACEADTGGCCWPQSYGCSNGLQEGQFSSSPSACYLYNICHNGQLLQGNCGAGNYFNSATNTCEADTSGSCRPLNPNSPPQPPSYGCPNGVKEGQLIANPSSCYLYSICYNGQLLQGNCGTGNYFNNATNACEADTGGCCWPQSYGCSNGLQEGQFSSSPSACYLYNICHNGQLLQGNCGAGNYFNSATNTCEADTSGSCRQLNPNSSPQPPSYGCPNGVKEGQLIANPSSCYLYSICYNGQILQGNCGTGNYFNNATNACEADTGGCCWPQSYGCSNGLQEGQFSSSPSACYLYNICHNGQLLQGNCGAGNYFNSATNTCEADTSGSCRPLNPNSPPQPPFYGCSNGLKEGQFSSSPSACYLYNICHNGQLLQGNCGTGNYFNSATNTCEADTSGSCRQLNPYSPPQPPSYGCPNGVKEGQFIANPSSCYLYSICHNGQLLQGNCGTGNYFNRATNTCEADTSGSCRPLNPNSPPQPPFYGCSNGLKEGQFSSSPSACYLYNICHNGQLLQGNCGAGNYFNSATNTCEADTSGSCRPLNPNSPPQPPFYGCSNGLKEGQFSSNPSACYLYNICHNGQLLQGNCGAGNYFNSATNTCEADTSGTCRQLNPNSPPQPPSYGCPNGVKEGQLIANPSSCYLYSICYNGKLLQGNCGTGNYFNNATDACEADTGGCCWPQSYGCSNGLQEGQFSSSPSACYLYNICHNGQLLQGNCGAGNYFNSATNTCEADTSGSCRPLNPNSPPQPPSYGCPNGLKEGQFTANPSSCYLYSICYNGQLMQGNCGTGNYFNSATNTCQPDTAGSCWPQSSSNLCPNGLQEGQFTASQSSCYLYNICHNGELVEGNCGTGNYFNSATNTCNADTEGCCWPLNPPSIPEPDSCLCPNGLQEGQFTSSPSSCYLYNICHNGELVEGNCGTGNYFNNVTNICEPDTGGCCWPSNTECPGGYASGDFVPDPSQCDKFFICYQGALVPQDCGVGYFFDIFNNYCTRDINGTCWAVPVPENTCDGVADGTFLVNETFCDKYSVCYNNVKIGQECGIGNYFNSDTRTCVRDTLGTCWKKVTNVCANAITGTFVQNPLNCQEFYVCYQNRAILQQCGDGNWFNPQLMICQPDLNATCINVCQGSNTSLTLPHPNCNQFYACANGLTTRVGNCPNGTNFDPTLGVCLTSAICEADLCVKSRDGDIYPVQNDLASFYACEKQIPVKHSCPDGASFDQDRLICTPDTGRCIGQKNGFAVASYHNPNAYYVCKNNMAIFEQCPSYAIFDEKRGICVQAQRKRLANNKCATEPDGTMLPGDACNEYHLCLDGEDIAQNCGAYSSFNKNLGYCTLNLTCFNEVELCAKSSDTETFPDARHENTFIKCKRGLAVIEKCPKNMIYSHDIGYCVPKELAMSSDELVQLCENASDNTMAPALDCRKFYICINNVAILQQCASDQHFGVMTGTCLPDVERQCWIRSETLRGSFFIKTVCHEGQIRAHPIDCDRYEICAYGVWTAELCPARHLFDSTSQVCVPGDAGKMCPSARSVECSDDMPLRASENVCTDYYRCENNHWKAAKCPIGEFFSAKMATCTSDASACARSMAIKSVGEKNCTANETRADELNCGLFHVCHEGEWWYRYCEEGYYFNRSLAACTPNDGTCRSLSVAGPCRNGTVQKSDFDPCIVYHLCVDGNWTTQHCPDEHYFDETRKACMLDDGQRTCQNDIKNISSSCKDGDRRYQSSNCAAFDICSFGNWLSVACRSQFYFDTSLKICMRNRGECSANGLMRRECVENTSRPKPGNCSEFYYCSRSKWQLESCLEGFQYNATIDKCIPQKSSCETINMSNWMKDKCSGLKSGSSVAHESDCTKYYLCVDGVAVEAECTADRFYDNESKYCELNNGACPLKTLTDDSVCQGKSNGSHVQNPANCTTFYICTDTLKLLSYCPPEHYFNAVIGACQMDTGICNKPRLCDGNPSGRLPHETYCNIYYSCVRGMAIPVACEEDHIFDPTTRNCIFDTEHRCIDGILVGNELCAPADDGKALVDSDDCTKYVVCTNGLAQIYQCPPGKFFDSKMLKCMSDDGSCPFVDGPDLPNNHTIPPDPITCTGKHGYLMPDPEHCNEFYVCIYGNLRHERCFDGEFFDLNTYSCRAMADEEKCPTAAEMTTMCVNSEEGTSFADQADCRKYYQCNDGELQSKKCRNGESFDTLLGFCRQNDGTCLLENGQRVGACAGKHGKLAADSENCRGYFTCINGQKISEECDSGEYFVKATRKCEKDVNSTCRPLEGDFTNTTQLSCDGLTELVFYPNVIDGCKTFFQCVKELPRVHKCPDDLLFNGKTGICDWKDYVECIDMSQHYQIDKVCLNAINGTRYGSSEDNCDSYFICNDGKMSSFKCDQGHKYNAKLEKCDLAANVNCTMTS